jgi:hypothetical protein
MFESCLLRIYELLSEQKQRARLNDVNIKVSFRLVYKIVFVYVRVGNFQHKSAEWMPCPWICFINSSSVLPLT